MDNAQKAIMIGVGLFITIVIISAVLLITNLGTDLVADAGDEVANMSSAVKQTLLDQYDGKTLTKKQTLELFRKYATSDEVTVALVTSSKTTCVGAGSMSGLATSSASYKVGGIIGTYSATKGTNYSTVSALVTAEKYASALVYNNDGALLGVAVVAK